MQPSGSMFTKRAWESGGSGRRTIGQSRGACVLRTPHSSVWRTAAPVVESGVCWSVGSFLFYWGRPTPQAKALDFVRPAHLESSALPSRQCRRTTKLQKFVEPRCPSPSACLRHMHGAAFAVSVVALLESWYVCLPYRHLSWFAVRRPSICLLLCSAQRAHDLVSPLYRRGAYANVSPRHGRTLTVEWTFRDSLIFQRDWCRLIAPSVSRLPALGTWRCHESQLADSDPAGASKLTERSSFDLRIYCT